MIRVFNRLIILGGIIKGGVSRYPNKNKKINKEEKNVLRVFIFKRYIIMLCSRR